MSKYTEMTDEQYFAAQDEFIEKYRAPQCEPIEVLDLIMRREFAEEILSGKKKVEVRQGSDFYFSRLTDKKVDKWMTDHRDEPGDSETAKIITTNELQEAIPSFDWNGGHSGRLLNEEQAKQLEKVLANYLKEIQSRVDGISLNGFSLPQ